MSLAGLLLSGLAGALAYFMPVATAIYTQTGQKVSASPQPGSAAAGASPTSPFTVLLLGSDNDAKFDADQVNTQTMILVRVDPVARKVTMLSIPRDLWVTFASGGQGKIQLAYSRGKEQAAMATVERNFHVRVDDYVWVGLKGLVKLIDMMGGVDVITTNPVLDDFYPADLESSNPYAYKRVAVLPGPQHMSGMQALEYVRSRHSDLQQDFGRSKRQQQVLLALRLKARNLKPADLPDLATTFQGELKTSIGIDRTRQLLPLAQSINDLSRVEQLFLLPPYTSDARSADGQEILIPNWGLILPLVQKHFR